jgi:multiple sugar transport system ATP-binding protein
MAGIGLEGVSKVYSDGTEAVAALDLEIEDGEFVVLVGPSGCGKTSVLRMIAGLEEVSSGSIRIGNRVVNHLLPKDRDIAMVFQNYALYPHMSVFDNMAFGLRQRKMPKAEVKERVTRAAYALGLFDSLDKKPRTLSGGQRQRVAMGRAIVREPQVFLMDEPLSNLDAKLRVEMRAEIARIQRDLSVTTVYVTHDQTEAMTMGDRVAVMRKGLLQQVGAPQALYDRPANLFVAEFIGSPAMNLVEAELEQSDGTLTARFGDHALSVGCRALASRPALASYAGRRVLVGIRPEDVEDADLVNEAPAERRLAARVDIREDMGPEVYIHLSLGVPPVRRPEVEEAIAEEGADPGETLAARTAFVGRLGRGTRAKEGEAISLVVNADRLYFFDPDSGLAIEQERAS